MIKGTAMIQPASLSRPILRPVLFTCNSARCSIKYLLGEQMNHSQQTYLLCPPRIMNCLYNEKSGAKGILVCLDPLRRLQSPVFFGVSADSTPPDLTLGNPNCSPKSYSLGDELCSEAHSGSVYMNTCWLWVKTLWSPRHAWCMALNAALGRQR